MHQLLLQQKVYNNLKHVNEVAIHKRKLGKKQHKENEPVKSKENEGRLKKDQIQVVDDQQLHAKENLNPSDENKPKKKQNLKEKVKKQIVNIQVQPDILTNQIKHSFDLERPSTTKEKNHVHMKLKSVKGIKVATHSPKPIKTTALKQQVVQKERPQTSINNYSKEYHQKPSKAVNISEKEKLKGKVVFQYIGGDRQSVIKKQNAIHSQHQQHQSILSNKSQETFEVEVVKSKNPSSKKQRSSKSQNRMIIKLMKQLKLQQMQIDMLTQNLLGKEQEGSTKPIIKSHSRDQLISNQNEAPESRVQQPLKRDNKQVGINILREPKSNQIKRIHQEKQQVKEEVDNKLEIGKPIPKHIKQEANEKIHENNSNNEVLIENDMMIFVVLNTAATFIQNKFREYQLRKKAKQQRNLNEQNRVEDRIIPQIQGQEAATNKAKRPSQKESITKERLGEVKTKTNSKNEEIKHDNESRLGKLMNYQSSKQRNPKKQQKHTFSFGHQEEQKLAIASEHGIAKSVPQQNDNKQKLVHYDQTDTNKLLEHAPFQRNSIIDEAKDTMIEEEVKQHSNQQEYSNIQLTQQNNISEQQMLEHQASENESARSSQQSQVDKILNINDKFKFALRNLADKQKKSNIFDEIQSKKKKELSQIKQQNIKNSLEDRGLIVSNPTISGNANDQVSVQKPKFYINDGLPSKENSLLKQMIAEHGEDNSENPLNMEAKDFIDLSKISIEIIEDDAQVDKTDRNEAFNGNMLIFDKAQLADRSILDSLQDGELTERILLNQDNFNQDEVEDRDILEALKQDRDESNTFTINQEESAIINPSEQDLPSKIEDQSAEQYNQEEEEKVPINDRKFTKFDIGDNLHQQRYQSQNRPKEYQKLKTNTDPPIEFLESHQSNPQNRHMLRIMFGDEKFLLDYDHELHHLPPGQQSPHSQLSHKYGTGPYGINNLHNDSHNGGGGSVGTGYFLATNASIFERNPFHEFTTNKLQELLQGKNLKELSQLREEACRFQEQIEKGFIHRQEVKQEISPKTAQNRKFELEKWVSAEKKVKQEKQTAEHPINLFELEAERREAAEIIQRVNIKAKEIQTKLQGQPSTIHKFNKDDQGPSSSGAASQLNLALEEVKSSDVSDFINKHLSHAVDDKLSSSKSNSRPLGDLNILVNVEEEKLHDNRVSEKINKNIIDLEQQETNFTKQQSAVKIEPEQQQKQPAAVLVLDISMEDEEEELEKSVEKQHQNLPFIQKSVINEQQIASQTEQLTQQIFQELISEELQSMNLQRSQISTEIKLQSLHTIEQIQEELKQGDNNTAQVQTREQGVTSNVAQSSENALVSCEFAAPTAAEHQQQQQSLTLGIDTSEAAIDQYIEEIFEQIRPRKDQFLQAFITPIFKNPLDVLANLQKPDFGGAGGLLSDENNTTNLLDATNSLAYILNVQLYLTLEKAKENIIHEAIEALRRQHMIMSGSQKGLNADNLGLLDEEMADLMSEAQHIHNKVVFDCVNESLNLVRPYGNMGEPMPWSKKARRNLIFLFDSADDLDTVLNQVKQTVLTWARTKAGALPQQKNVHSYQAQPPEFINGVPVANQITKRNQPNEEDPALAHQRERCLAHMLAQDLVREEEKWLDYEMEEAQVKIDLSDIILEHLVGETVDILNKARSRQFSSQ